MNKLSRMLMSSNNLSITAILTKKELECFVRLLHGETIKEIAQTLTRSKKTIEAHIYRIKEKLNCRVKSQLFKKALEEGLIKINY